MANRRPQGRRMDFGRNDRGKSFGRSGVSPWQGGAPGGGLPNLLPLAGGSTEATLALASNLINLLQPRQNPVPSLLDMPIRRDFGPNMGRFDGRGYGPARMGNQGNFRRTGNYNRAGERINTNRKPFRPNDGQRQQNKSSPKKDADSKAKTVKESEEDKPEGEATDKGETKSDEKKDTPKTRYDELNPQLLKCHICNKSMWDGRSFENHLSGRAHAIMMQKTAESYALTADTMRQEFKIREMKRTRKTGQQPPRDFYCAMCDLYAADGAIHRTTVGHRKLKKYLHPTCTSCHKEMPTRIELDEHRLTAEHLRNMQDKAEVVTKPKPEVMVISTLNMEQMYVRDDRQRGRHDRDDKRRGEDAGAAPDDEKKDDAEAEKKEEETVIDEALEGTAEGRKEGLDNENTVLDFKMTDDLTHVTRDMVPAYCTERGVGRSFLAEFRCVQCALCRKLLADERTAAVHLRTWRHHQLFCRALADRAGHAEKDKEARKSTLVEPVKRSHRSEEDGNWKRRKTSRKDAEGEGEGDGEAEDESETDKPNGHDEVASETAEVKENPAEIETDLPTNTLPTSTTLPAEDELEDWEQSVDEILKDEQSKSDDTPNTEEATAQTPDTPVEAKEEMWEDEKQVEDVKPSPKPVPTVKPTPPPTPTPTPTPPSTPAAKARATPRGRGRGRRRYY